MPNLASGRTAAHAPRGRTQARQRRRIRRGSIATRTDDAGRGSRPDTERERGRTPTSRDEHHQRLPPRPGSGSSRRRSGADRTETRRFGQDSPPRLYTYTPSGAKDAEIGRFRREHRYPETGRTCEAKQRRGKGNDAAPATNYQLPTINYQLIQGVIQ